MKMTVDPQYNIAYIRFREAGEQVTTVKLSDAINVDTFADGTVYGIELLNANEQLTEDSGNLVVEAAGERREISLSS